MNSIFICFSILSLEVQRGLGLTNFADTKCGQRSVSIIPKVSRISRIVGGAEAVRGEFPWIVSLLDNTGKHFCGGFLISNRYAITAAHCLQKDIVQVIVGEHVIGVEEVPLNAFGVGVESIIQHPEYNAGAKTRNDIAIIRLQDTIEWNAFVQPACLPSPGELVPVGEKASLAGWGFTTTDDPEISKSLMTVDIPVIGIADCLEDYEWTPTDSEFCAGVGYEGRGGCKGDSGSPLMLWEKSNESLSVVGIHSAGCGCVAGMPSSGIYTRLASYIHWIKYNLR